MSFNLDPRLPPLERCIQRLMIDHWVDRQPDRIFAVFADDSTWTWADMRARVVRTANALRALGVRQGDRVLVWMPNSADNLRVWFALNWLGAVYVPVNISYRGGIMEHAIRLSEAQLAIVHVELAPRLDGIDTAGLTRVVQLGGAPVALAALPVLGATALDSDDDTSPEPERPIAPWDLQSIIFTSGTTGPSKGVLSSYAHLQQMAASAPFLGHDDRYMINLPLFHSGGVMPVTAMLYHGGSIAMADAFNTETFWPTVRRQGITTVVLLGVMGNFLLKRPPGPDDRDHSLRTCTYVPLDENALQFNRRFGTEVHTHFNMTEISMPILSVPNPDKIGSAGRPRSGVEVRLVDENDCEVPVGTMGEMIVRTDCPWAMNHGYAANPEATAAAWRNGWFHTGDGFRRDADGHFYFVDRLKDAIRRRGENVSSFEVESEILVHPAVREVAVVAVKSDVAEDEILAVIALHDGALRDGAAFDPAELIAFLRGRMAHFMVPRYLRLVDALPRTPTAKVQKFQLRAEGLTPDTWDREAAGILIKRERIGAGQA